MNRVIISKSLFIFAELQNIQNIQMDSIIYTTSWVGKNKL